ncbi:GPI ethanolamine phosphate transferase 1 [Iris pallida]|uniref:GPI ethanolamine phosphate transferase 1 n=1 Tax=Iris pallida TaxID=29817 RepID=A0AAX6E8A3_IRIPA|nr:GPI ethanolamine phosphate transferase 1 [Iris pallida]
MAGSARRRPPRGLHAQHLRHLLQDPHSPRHGPRPAPPRPGPGLPPRPPRRRRAACRQVLRAGALGGLPRAVPAERHADPGTGGVSHARPPTESRPGHVAIIAGFYEDPSAVTKGWKANPVEFDSVFNRSRHTVSYGSPDIVPIFCGALPHSTWASYPHEFEDFATDASFLDQWSFDQFHSLLNRSYDDPNLRQLLLQDKLVIFLHLLGCDTNGHAHRPYSPIYLNNVKIVDQIAESVYNLVESYFNDNRTAYIFTADHGMSDKGLNKILSSIIAILSFILLNVVSHWPAYLDLEILILFGCSLVGTR